MIRILRRRTRAIAVGTSVCLATTSLQAGLVGYWNFDGNTQDQSGTGNHGELMGASYVNSFPAVLGAGQSLSFEDPTQHVFVPASPTLNSKTFTLSMFVNDQGQASNINRFTSRASDTFETGIDKVFGTDSISYYSPAAGWVRTGTVADIDAWTHLAFVADGENMTVYQDGGEIFAGAFTAAPTGFMHIGNRWNDVEGFFGLMDDVALWDVALPAASIGDLAKATKRPPQIPVPEPPPPPPKPFLSVVSDAATWKLSSESHDGGEAGEWIPTGDPLPAVSTYTLDAIATEVGVVPHIHGAASALDVGGIQADNDTHFYRTTFQLPRTDALRAEIQLAVDNGAQLFINGQLLGSETSFLVDNWTGSLPSISIGADGKTEANKFEEVAASFTGWKAGENEVVLALRNPVTENSPAGGFAFRMDFFDTGAGLTGDFDKNGVVNAADIDALSARIRAGNGSMEFDLNSDGAVNDADRDQMVTSVLKTWYGDANLDDEFNSADFVYVFTAGEYEDALSLNSKWATGDWNGDGEFNSSDFVKAFTDGGYEQGPRAAVAAVPEPTAGVLFALGLLGVARRRRS